MKQGLNTDIIPQYVRYVCVCVCVCRFDDAGHYYWLLAKSCLSHARRDHLGQYIHLEL